MAYMTNKQVADWLKKTAYGMAKRDTAECVSLFVDKGNRDLALAVGWLGGYAADTNDTDFHSNNPKGYALNAAIVKYNPADCCDLEYMEMPTNDDTGDVWDTACTLGTATNWDGLARFYIKEFKAIVESQQAAEAAEAE